MVRLLCAMLARKPLHSAVVRTRHGVVWLGREGWFMPGFEVRETRIRCVLPFEAAPAELRLLRRTVARQLTQWGMPVVADEAKLLVTELATNVLKHVGEGAPATLVLEWRGARLRVEVHDKSPVVPSVRTAGCDEECGRGLPLLAALSLDWGAVLTAAGKAVWCEISAGPVGGCQRLERAVAALVNYQSATGNACQHGRSLEMALGESAVELIADLLHWTAARGGDPDDILDRAQIHYEAEGRAA
ncbi:ATP-binding protein [Streptomyces sp. NPDC089424]|uniref:ATP-binding protein n=1 Tax=Streptomyces sp. NPDC089424 TaxID=3365917 RepID=UPI0038200E02